MDSTKMRPKRWAIHLIWVVAALFTSTQLYLKVLDANGTESWFKLFWIQLLVWSIWGLFSPGIFWLGKRFRIDRQTYFQGVFIHIVLAVPIVLAYLAIYSLIWNFLGVGSVNWQGFQTYFKVFFLNLFHWHFFIYMAIIGGSHALQYHRESEKRAMESASLEKQLILSELNTIKAQLSPHFLFNTINNVISTIEQGKSDRASGMLVRLGDFLRCSLQESKHDMISLKKELEYVRTYLEIEKFRNPELQILIDEKKELLHHRIPNFILQPIVENGIKHGISKSKKANRIELGMEQTDPSHWKLWIYNEGPPYASHKPTHGKGIGLQNTQDRLAQVYRGKASIELMATNDGTLVEIKLPLV